MNRQTRSTAPINDLTPHAYHICSDLPNLSKLGIFSCDACDRWRTKDICGRRILKPRHELKTFCCTRVTKKLGPIRIKVVCGVVENPCNGVMENVEEVDNTRNIVHVPPDRIPSPVSEESDEIGLTMYLLNSEREARSKLEQTNFSLQTDIMKRKAEVASEVEKRLKLEKTLSTLQNELVKKEQKISNLQKKVKPFNGTAGCYNAQESFRKGIEKLAGSILPKKHNKKKASLLMESILDGRLFNGEAEEALKEHSVCYVKKLFRPWRLLKAGDTSPIGALKTSTIQALRDVVDENKEGLFPSTSAVSRTRKLLDKEAVRLIGYECRQTTYGEVFFINFNKTLRLLLKACGLFELAQTESIQIALAIDGADMIRDRTHVSAGVKITDTRGYHPITKQPLLQKTDDGEEAFVRVQSFELCSLMMIADARDSKALYEGVFKEFYDWGKKISLVGLPAEDGMPALQPFQVLHNSDLKAAWYLSDRGGGCKTTKYFCTLCCCSKDELVSYKSGEQRCDRCKRRNKEKCYHHPVCDTVQVSVLLSQLEDQLGEYYEQHGSYYDEVIKKFRIVTDHTVTSKELQTNHIDFVLPLDEDEKVKQYAQFISRECYIRGIPLNGSHVEDWRAALRCCIAMENKIKFLLQVKEWHNAGRSTVPLVEVIELIIPCLLHLENRASEKIITCILRHGFSKFMEDHTTEASAKSYLDTIQGVFQKEILGTVESPSQWKMQWSKGSDGIVIENVQVRNQTGRKIISRVDKLIEAAIQEEATRAKLIRALQYFTTAMQVLTRHRNLTPEEKEFVQANFDDYFELWVEIFGRDGQSNYIHMIGSGHIEYFLDKYDCLYLYSQQGWEALNNTIQAFIHQNSQRGGKGSGLRAGERSFIFPLVRYMLRDLLWKTGDADKFFIDLEEKNETAT